MKVIEVTNLKFNYNGLKLLEDVSFSIETGQFVKLTGPNGSGKSTLIKLLIKEISAFSGNISLLGENIDTFKNWHKIGYLPQSKFGEGNFIATSMEIVLTGLYHEVSRFGFFSKKHKEKASEALKMVGMQDFKNSLLSNLSGGQLQRVMTARLLVANPEILILDEPLTGIDINATKDIIDILSGLKNQGVTTLMISHDTYYLNGVIDKTLCLECGNLIELDYCQIKKERECRHVHPTKGNY